MAEKSTDRPASGQVQELKTLVVGYAKQETIEPMKVTGARLGWGLAGAVLVALGSVFLVLAALRGFQQIEIFAYRGEGDNHWFTFVPHILAAILGFIGIGICASMISGSSKSGASRK